MICDHRQARNRATFLGVVVTSIAVVATGAPVQDAGPEFVDVFVSGRDEYPNYRIPSLVVTSKGTLLAQCEGRHRDHDHAANDIVLKRSVDGGRTWGPLQLLRDEGQATCNDAVMLALDTGRILLFYVRYPEEAHTEDVVPGYEGLVSRHFVMLSDDDGVSWTAPREVTRQVKRPQARATSQGPGVGLQLRRGPHAGRICIPMWEDAGAIYALSDDRGQTWRHSQPVPGGVTDGRPLGSSESQLVELADGTILMNCRDGGGFRNRSTSHDGGETWAPVTIEQALPDSSCQGSLLLLSDPLDGATSRLLFSNPASQLDRFNGTIRLSYDEGRTWPVSKQLVPGTFCYSCLARLPDGTIGLLFEQRSRTMPMTVTFARFSLAWLTDGKDQLP